MTPFITRTRALSCSPIRAFCLIECKTGGEKPESLARINHRWRVPTTRFPTCSVAVSATPLSPGPTMRNDPLLQCSSARPSPRHSRRMARRALSPGHHGMQAASAQRARRMTPDRRQRSKTSNAANDINH